MIIDLLVVIDLQQRIGAGGGLRIATIEEPGAVMRPRRARELDPLQMISAVLARDDVAHAELLPVGAAAGRAVHHRAAILGEGEDRERDGAVGRQRVGIEQHFGLRRQ